MFTAYRPVELGGKAIKQFQADLKKYAGLTGVPDYGTYTGYIVCDMMIKGLQAAGKNPTRQAFVDGIRKTTAVSTTAPGCLCQPIDLSYETFGKIANDELHLVRQREGRQVQGAQRREAGDREAGRRPRAHRAVREQHRWGHHHGTASDRSTLTQPRSSCEGSRFAGSPRRVTGPRAQLVGRIAIR